MGGNARTSRIPLTSHSVVVVPLDEVVVGEPPEDAEPGIEAVFFFIDNFNLVV